MSFALVLAGGEPPPPRLARALVDGVGPVVAADGGLRHATALGLTPDLVVGDLDSAPAELLASHAGVPVERHPRTKDSLDLELALDAARRLGASSARVLGAFGGRLDQGVAALLVAARLALGAPPFPVSLHGGQHEAHVAAPGVTVAEEWPAGTTVSLLALGGDAVATAQGLVYAVDGLVLPFGTGLGVSNVSRGGPVTVSCGSGAVAVLVEHGPA